MRNGVFIGAYVPQSLKESLQQEARNQHRTLSQEVTRILELYMQGISTERARHTRRATDRAESQPAPATLRDLFTEDERASEAPHEQLVADSEQFIPA